ncbi:MAG: hypothetical protein O3A55_03410 [Bacteroidetes bacterium]|nr:hypothetical protein [Bacteroidota bacterium]
MKKYFKLFLTILCLSLGVFSYSDSGTISTQDECPLIGTPVCPINPDCCK